MEKVVDAIVATMRWIATHTAAQTADKMPPAFVNNGLVTRTAYTAELGTDKGQFLPNGMMPPGARATALAVDKLAGNIANR